MKNTPKKYNRFIDYAIKNETHLDGMTLQEISDIQEFVLSIADAISEVASNCSLTPKDRAEAYSIVCEAHKRWEGFERSLLYYDLCNLISQLQMEQDNSLERSKAEHIVIQDVLHLRKIRFEEVNE